MALVDYKKYQVFINSDSKKVQGLQTGDIVRRQYFDGTNVIYSLMCVLAYGTARETGTTGESVTRPYFIGALLEGDALDSTNKNELFDFARITNLFNVNRLGALYLTASDDSAPYMDVIDGIGRNKSLSWPEGIALEGYEDSASQYIIKGSDNFQLKYTGSSADTSRILTVTRTASSTVDFEGLKQDFYQYIRSGNQIIVSYKIRGSIAISGVGVSIGYTDDLHKDAEWTEDIDTAWKYKMRVVTVEYSGRHLRSFKLDMSKLGVNEYVEIADFNIILLSSVSNFSEASATRVGKLDGVVDNVFGQMSGYGAYLQRLYASRSAHISGTLTAGDENGFGATFYAGKIHRNCFVNSLSPSFISDVYMEGSGSDVTNPTGVGAVYRSNTTMEFVAQTSAWVSENAGDRYCFSFWLYMKQPGTVAVWQNDKEVGTISVTSDQTYEWHRVHICYDIIESETEDEPMSFRLAPIFTYAEYQTAGDTESNPNVKLMYFTAPQLESGDTVTQYQATDDTLNPTTEYGAWFSRGGIGGTMQNPLLQLNFKDDDGNEGGIGTRSKSLLLRQDGSGYLANKNIEWQSDGRVTFGEGATLNWSNLDSTVRKEISSKSVKITGSDTFTMLGDESSSATEFYPKTITLTVEEENITSASNQRQWYYLKDSEWVKIQSSNAKQFVVYPDAYLWNDASVLTLKYIVTIGTNVYSDTFTIRKQHIVGYTVEVTSNQGKSFKNGSCSTTLRADVYYQGKLVDSNYIADNFTFVWKKYHLPDVTNEVSGWWKEQQDVNGNVIQEAIDRTQQEIVLGYQITGSDLFICELQNGSSVFPYTFPIILA